MYRVLLIVVALACGQAACAESVPAWFQRLTQAPLPTYSVSTDAVVLLDETTTTVRDNGDVTTHYRWAAKILRPGGRHLADYRVSYDNETRLTSFRAWSVMNGKDFTLTEKDGVETMLGESFFEDTRTRHFRIPADVGAYIAVEFERKDRPYVLQDLWYIQGLYPQRVARYTLQLPKGWEYKSWIANWKDLQPQQTGNNQWTWELTDVPGFEIEREMPSVRTFAGFLAVGFIPPDRGKTITSWRDVSAWDNSLNAEQRTTSPAMQQRVAQLTASAATPLEKIRALGAYVQRNVRYVAIEIGIGGFRAHPAADVFAKSYGDCKDKATVLASMLKLAGIDSHLMLVHTRRGIVKPDVPAALSFNHAILAIKLPDGADTASLHAVVNDEKFGRLLIFDPTSETTPVGLLPDYLQAGYGLVVAENGGTLVKLPLAVPEANRLARSGRLNLGADGSLTGEIQEVRTGSNASSFRAALLQATEAERKHYAESMLADSFGQYQLFSINFENLDKYDQPLIVKYKFTVPQYSKFVGGLLLVRPRVLGEKARDIAEGKPRQFPVEYSAAALHTDTFDIVLPSGYKVDELPPATNAVQKFAEYHSRSELKDDVLHYERTYTIKDVLVPLDEMANFKKLMRTIAADERSTGVLKR